MKNVKKQVENSLVKFANKPESICVALSGGADSVCLLHTLNSISKSLGFKLSAVHINHNIRGNEAKRDEDFCVELCEKLGVPLKVISVSVLTDSKKGESVELAARRLRYKAFNQVDAQYIATAHNADDSLETFLINFCRGTGLKGLTGIPNVRGKFIRPLNRCSKVDVLEYINSNGLQYVTDSTNLSVEYTRNKIRNNVIPLLKEISPELINVSLRNIELLKNDNDFLEQQSNELYKASLNKNGSLMAQPLLKAHTALSGRVISKFIFDATNRYPDNFHLKLIIESLDKKSFTTELFGGFSVKLSRGYLNIIKLEKMNFSVETKAISKENFEKELKINKLLLKNAIDYDKIVGELNLRTRKADDRLRPLCRGLSKPVRRLQAEANIISELRDYAPLASDDLGVVWGYKIGIDERLKIDENTKNILVFKVLEEG